jgi:hypothetical protein
MNGQMKSRSGVSQSGLGFPYNGITGKWWLERAADTAHQTAYRNIAGFVRNSMSRDPRLIVDYACGAGDLLVQLGPLFPDSRLIGVDGSSLLLNRAKSRMSRLPRNCAERISLIESALPGQAALCAQADLIIYCFPNMMPSSAEEERNGAGCRLSETERRIAQRLTKEDNSDEVGRHFAPAAESWNPLEHGRSISWDIRRFLVRGGICVRAEYATTRRHEWSELELQQVSFEEGSLDTVADGVRLRPWFRVLASAYFRSKVLEDVFQQTGDERDTNGGYLITILRAV